MGSINFETRSSENLLDFQVHLPRSQLKNVTNDEHIYPAVNISQSILYNYIYDLMTHKL